MTDKFQYRRDFFLGDLFTWTPFTGVETVPGAWYKGLPKMIGLITEVTYTLDDSGVKISPAVAM